MKLLPRHECHRYPGLVKRWRETARQTGLTMKKFAEHDGFPLYVLETRRPLKNAPHLYLSAGIHGDEPASTEGLLSWVSRHGDTLQKTACVLFPCLNPWGLTANIRGDSRGRDLNRQFHDTSIPAFRALHRLIAGRQFDLAITLHEDYDAQGIYIYELDSLPAPLSPILLESVQRIIPPDPRSRIEGRKVSGPGYLHRSIKHRGLPEGPEAIYLARNQATLCFTLETPSEFSLDRRVRAQRRMLQTAVQLVLKKG